MVGGSSARPPTPPPPGPRTSCLAGLAAERYRRSRIVAFSTGERLPARRSGVAGALRGPPPLARRRLRGVLRGQGARARARLAPGGTPMAIVRLNYAIDLRYGVLLDVAGKVLRGEPIDARHGRRERDLAGRRERPRARPPARSASSPPFVLNVAGPAVSMRELAERIGAALGSGRPSRPRGGDGAPERPVPLVPALRAAAHLPRRNGAVDGGVGEARGRATGSPRTSRRVTGGSDSC